MQKIIAVSFLVALAAAGTINPFVLSDSPNDWPQLNTFTTFKASVEVYTWDGKTLAPFKDTTADAKVDSDRNKVKLDAKVTVPIFGAIDAQVVVDFTLGSALEYVPFLGLCQHTPLNETLNLKDLMQKIYSPTGGLTKFDGESGAPFDTTKMFKFTSSYTYNNTLYTADSYFDESSKSAKWIQGLTTGYVVKMPTGEKQATFTDADFKISGCNTIITDPA
jgi:hypothetical protein